MIVTVVCSEKSSPLPPVSPWPLIYTLEVADPRDESAIQRAVALLRYGELECGDPEYDPQTFQAVLEGVEVHFAFEGDVPLIEDFRE